MAETHTEWLEKSKERVGELPPNTIVLDYEKAMEYVMQAQLDDPGLGFRDALTRYYKDNLQPAIPNDLNLDKVHPKKPELKYNPIAWALNWATEKLQNKLVDMGFRSMEKEGMMSPNIIMAGGTPNVNTEFGIKMITPPNPNMVRFYTTPYFDELCKERQVTKKEVDTYILYHEMVHANPGNHLSEARADIAALILMFQDTGNINLARTMRDQRLIDSAQQIETLAACGRLVKSGELVDKGNKLILLKSMSGQEKDIAKYIVHRDIDKIIKLMETDPERVKRLSVKEAIKLAEGMVTLDDKTIKEVRGCLHNKKPHAKLTEVEEDFDNLVPATSWTRKQFNEAFLELTIKKVFGKSETSEAQTQKQQDAADEIRRKMLTVYAKTKLAHYPGPVARRRLPSAREDKMGDAVKSQGIVNGLVSVFTEPNKIKADAAAFRDMQIKTAAAPDYQIPEKLKGADLVQTYLDTELAAKQEMADGITLTSPDPSIKNMFTAIKACNILANRIRHHDEDAWGIASKAPALAQMIKERAKQRPDNLEIQFGNKVNGTLRDDAGLTVEAIAATKEKIARIKQNVGAALGAAATAGHLGPQSGRS